MTTTIEQHILDTASNRHLDWLESEAIHILREVAAECTKPVAAIFRRQGFGGAAAAGRKKRFARGNSRFR